MPPLAPPALDPAAVPEVFGSGYPEPFRSRIENRSGRPARYLEVGNRIPGEYTSYPDDDLTWIPSDDGEYAAHKDGRRY